MSWTKWRWDRFRFEYFDSPLPISFHQDSILITIYALILPEGQTGEAWDPSKSTAFSEFYVSPTTTAVKQFASGTAHGPTVPASAPSGPTPRPQSASPDHRPCELRYRPILKSCHEPQEVFSRNMTLTVHEIITFFPQIVSTIIRMILPTNRHYFPVQHSPTALSNGNHSVLYEVRTLGILLLRRTNTRLEETSLWGNDIFRMDQTKEYKADETREAHGKDQIRTFWSKNIKWTWLIFRPDLHPGAKKRSCSPKCQDLFWGPPSLVFSTYRE